VDPAPHCRFWRSPDRFDPSRFMPDTAPPPRFAYMPFGAGPRICVGGRFALTELVLVVANLVRTFRIDVPPHRPVAPVGLVTLQPDVPPPSRLTPHAA
jgi:cytochrome P450